MTYSDPRHRTRGYSLTEMMLVLAIISVVGTLTLWRFKRDDPRTVLRDATQDLLSDLKKARARAITAPEWYVSATGDSEDPATDTNQTQSNPYQTTRNFFRGGGEDPMTDDDAPPSNPGTETPEFYSFPSPGTYNTTAPTLIDPSNANLIRNLDSGSFDALDADTSVVFPPGMGPGNRAPTHQQVTYIVEAGVRVISPTSYEVIERNNLGAERTLRVVDLAARYPSASLQLQNIPVGTEVMFDQRGTRRRSSAGKIEVSNESLSNNVQVTLTGLASMR